MKSAFRECLTLLGVGFSLAVAHAGAIISTLPEPTEEGVYVLAGSSTVDTSDLAKFSGMSYVDWAALQAAGLPDNAQIKFTGGVLFDSLPQDRGYAYDFSSAKGIGTIKSAALPAGYKLVVPSGCSFRFLGASITCDAEAGTYSLTKDTTETAKGILCDLELNGSMMANDAGRPPMHGQLTGKGTVLTSNWNMTMSLDGELLFSGTLRHSNQTSGNTFSIKSPTVNATVDTLQGYISAASYNGIQSFLYEPARGADDPPCTLNVATMDCGWGKVKGAFGENMISNGVGVLLHSGNALKINLVTHECMFIVADSTHKKPTFTKGFANVTIGNFGSSSDGTIAVSPNVNLTTGFHWQRNFTVEYRYWTNVVNRGTLDVTKTLYDYTSLAINGFEPANLPRTIKVLPSFASRSTVNVTNDVWTLPFDFGKATAEEVNIAGCDSNCSLNMPERGTVLITNVTTDSDAVYPSRWVQYPIMTCAADGVEKFANWTVEFTGDWPTDVEKEKVVTDTGLYVRVRKPHGMVLHLK